MKKIILLMLVVCTLSFGSLTHSSYTQEDIRMLKDFDIDEDFLKDPLFYTMMDGLETYNKDNFIEKLNNAYLFMPVLKKMIQDAGIPPAFLYLAMAESNFSLRAFSNKKAVGLWQFMPETGKKFGLKIDKYVDERRDLIRSTEAAIRYLKHLHTKFGKWYLAALAYNCGEGRVDYGINRANSDSLSTILKFEAGKSKQSLPKESRMYIRKILSLAVMANRADFLIPDESSHLLSRGATSPVVGIDVSGGVHLKEIANAVNISYSELKSLNVHLNYDITPTYASKYQIYIPYNRLAFFKANEEKLGKAKNELLEYQVKKGDTLFTISRKFGVPYETIKNFNKITSNTLGNQKVLMIPVTYGNQATDNSISTQQVANDDFTYVVRVGDTLDTIAKKFAVSAYKLKELNNITNQAVKVGDKIVISN